MHIAMMTTCDLVAFCAHHQSRIWKIIDILRQIRLSVQFQFLVDTMFTILVTPLGVWGLGVVEGCVCACVRACVCVCMCVT